MINIVFLCTIFLSFSYSFGSENFQNTSFNEKLLQPFFPIENSYKMVIPVFSSTENIPIPFLKEAELFVECLLHENTAKLLTACQNKTFGFCYAGMLNNNGNNPQLTIVNHEHPYYLNLQFYCFNSNTKDYNDDTGIIMRSKNMDPTFYPGLTNKKKILANAFSFWQTSCYHTQKDGEFYESHSSFWGPFFDKHNGAGCFFCTDIPSNLDPVSVYSPTLKKYPAYAIFYHYINKDGLKSYQPCYVSHTSSKYIPLYADEDQYFSLVLATFFPCKEINGKKIFYTYTYTVKELNSLKIYLDKVRKNSLNVPIPKRLKKYVQNSTLHVLLLHFLNQIKGEIENKEFNTEVNAKINALIKQKYMYNRPKNYPYANKKRLFSDFSTNY